ncbi:transcription initiation factor IIB-2-like [Papaver somniferum]|uniref:transcription initiation factor IIB-2-like n=1 Tax=Papaver somniferum TaxID=3469 RepID=UPI000E70141E|nr:transcription initiation factor IIB-2-like [Papaver somniferum]
MEETYCSDCKSVTAVIKDHSTGDAICSDGGLVSEAYSIGETSEWRTFRDESNDNGDDSNLLLSNNGLTIIPPSSNSSLRRFNPDKGLIKAFKAIEAMSERLGLVSTIKDLANEIYKKMADLKSRKRINKNAILAACLYKACKRLGKPRTMKEIHSVATGVTRKEIGRANSDISKHLEEIGDGVQCPSEIRRFCSYLGMSNKAVKAAQEAAAKTEECDIRRNPVTVAATIIYMISQLSDERKLIRDIAGATGAAEVTIKNSYKDIYPYALRLVPAWYVNEEDLRKLYRP